MKCLSGKTGQPHPGRTTVTLQRGETVDVIRDTLAEICEDCGDYYLDPEVTCCICADAEASLTPDFSENNT